MEAFGAVSRSPGEDGVAVCGPLVPRDVSPSDIESGAWLLVLTNRGVTPPSFESAGFSRCMDGVGSFTISRLHYPSPTLWEWVLLLL